METRRAVVGLLAALTAAAALLPARESQAAACCMSATSGGVGRLLIWEKAAVGVRFAPTVGAGFWSPDGDWYSYDGYRELELRTSLWSLVRLHRRVQASANVPLVSNRRDAGPLEDHATGIGDVSIGIRYEAIAIGELLGVPALAITAALVAPTGRSADEATGTLSADATGRGAWVPSLSLALETLHEPWFVRLDVTGAVPLPFERADNGRRIRYGESVSVGLTGGVELTQRLVLDLSLRSSLEARLVEEGSRMDDTSRLDVGIGPGLSWRALDHWTFTLAADTGIFADGVGRNQQGRVSGTVGVRYGIF